MQPWLPVNGKTLAVSVHETAMLLSLLIGTRMSWLSVALMNVAVIVV